MHASVDLENKCDEWLDDEVAPRVDQVGVLRFRLRGARLLVRP